MKMILASVLTTILIVAMPLGAMFILVQATEYVTALESPLQRAPAMGAELLLGVVLLLGTVWLATHLAVRIFASKDSPSDGEPVLSPHPPSHSSRQPSHTPPHPSPHCPA